jgi:hypothetical protein
MTSIPIRGNFDLPERVYAVPLQTGWANFL